MDYDNMMYGGSKDTRTINDTSCISDTLKQGLQFQKYLKKISQTGPNTGSNIEAFTQYEITAKLDELQRLKDEYTTLVNNFEGSGNTLRSGYTDYLNTFPNAAYTNKHVTIAGQNGYVTSKGVFKSYDGNGATFNNINGCPSTTNRITIAGTTLSNVLQTNGLRMGNPMTSGQSCGDEGSNVFVTRAPDVGITYSGCYQATDTAFSGLQLQPGGSIFNVGSCKQRAVDTGAAVFAIRNYDASSNRASCYTGATFVSPNLLGNAYAGSNLWTSADTPAPTGVTFQLPYIAQLKNGGFISIIDTSTDAKLVKQIPNTGELGCQNIPVITQFYVTPAPNVAETNLYTPSLASTLNPSGLPSFSFPISAIYPTAPTVAQNYTLKYTCGNVEQTKTITGGVPSTMITIGSCAPATSNCTDYYLILKDAGIIEINKGSGPPSASATTPPTSPLYRKIYSVTDSTANPQYLVSGGKTGVNFISSATPLLQNEYIASTDGKLVLIMQADGNLCLKTFRQQFKCSSSSIDTQTYGGSDAYALYNFNSPMDNSNIGKLAYIDDDGIRHAYPANMVQYDERNYSHSMNYDSPGNNMENMPITNSSNNECKRASYRLPTSGGYVYDMNTKNCWIKNKNLTLATPKTYAENVILGIKMPLPIVPTSCSDVITSINSARWKQYKTGSDMTPDFTCGASRAYSRIQRDVNVTEQQIYNKAIDIIGKIKELQNQGVTLTADIVAFKLQLQKSITAYENANAQVENDVSINSALSGMMNDADLMVLKENSRYLFLSIFAVGALVVALNTIKK